MADLFPSLAVTGSTGVVGGHVARLLADAGVAQRLLARSPGSAPDLPGTVVLPFTYSDEAASREALAGVDTLFMVSAAETAERIDEHRSFIDAAAASGVKHVIYTSFISAAPDAVFTLARDHYATEEHIKASGIRWTFLRDNMYLDFMPMLPGDDGVIRGPAGDGDVAAVARIDVARSAAAILQDPARHLGRTYDITGREALTLADAAEIISAAQHRPVTFHNETVEEAYESRKRWPAPDWQYDAWVSTYTAIASGAMAQVSHDVEALTGRPPITLAEFLAQQ